MNFTALKTDLFDALRSLCNRPLRSLLSSIGIGIGVAAMIAMLAISEGAGRDTLNQISSLGLHSMRLERAEAEHPGTLGGPPAQGFSVADVAELRAWVGARGTVGAFVRQDALPVRVGERTVTATVLGVTVPWIAAEQLPLASGRLLDEYDQVAGSASCLLGANLASRLEADLLDTVIYANRPAIVVGITAPHGRLLTEGTTLSSLDFDQTIILPVSAMALKRGARGEIIFDGVVIRLKEQSEQGVLTVAEQLTTLLLATRQPGDFQLVVPLALLQQAQQSQRLFAAIMGTIAGFSLLVGGIGVMNVMLANIAEQTREIGLRMAIGASPRRIISLYLCNASLLTLGGGLWGVGSGIAGALLIQHQVGWSVAFSPVSLLIAPLSALLAGLVFGIHPAIRAAALDPAIALRDT